MKEKKSVAEILCVVFPIITGVILIGCIITAIILPSIILNNTETNTSEKMKMPAQEEWSIVFTPIDFSASREDVISMLGQPYSEENNYMKYKCTYKENRGDLSIKLFGLDTDARKEISWSLKDGGTKEISSIYLSALKEKHGDSVYDYGINSGSGSTGVYSWWYYWISDDVDIVVSVEDSTFSGDCSLEISYYEPGTHNLSEIKKSSSDIKNEYHNR